MGGGGRGSEKSRKSVTYYLNGPLNVIPLKCKISKLNECSAACYFVEIFFFELENEAKVNTKCGHFFLPKPFAFFDFILRKCLFFLDCFLITDVFERV